MIKIKLQTGQLIEAQTYQPQLGGWVVLILEGTKPGDRRLQTMQIHETKIESIVSVQEQSVIVKPGDRS